MGNSSKKNIWNRRKGGLKTDSEEDDGENMNEEFLNNHEEQNELIWQVQQRLGVSREEARMIIQNSERM